jgi:hypothetical protein
MGSLRHRALLLLLVAATSVSTGCQSPTSADDTPDVDDILEVSISPDPASADASNDGRTYRVVRGNNQADEILAFDWKTTFSINLRLNDQADDDDYLDFPVDVTAATIVVHQASGGIVTTPTGGEVEHYDFTTSASTNRFAAVNSNIVMTFDVWYDLPSLKKEALINVTFTFKDEDGVVFSKTVDVKVAP